MRLIKLTNACFAALSLLIVGCSEPQDSSTTQSQPDTSKLISGAEITTQDFEPQYIGGYPTKETTEAMFEEYDYQAAVQFYVWAYAYLNGMGFDKGLAKLGGDEQSIYIFDKRVQSQHQIMTANSEVIYIWTRFMDVSKGPIVLEVPPRVLGHLYDISMRSYSDMGPIGPDRGKGGKYLIVNKDYKGEAPEGYFLVRAMHSNLILLGGRTFPTTEGSEEKAIELAKNFKWYYYDDRENQTETTYVLAGDRPFSQEWPRDERAFEWLAEAFNKDMVPESGKPHLGNMRRLGIEVGTPFNPDVRAQKILKRASKTGEAIILSMAYGQRNETQDKIYEDRQYVRVFANENPQFMQDNYEEVEERGRGWHELYGNFVFDMSKAPVGKGQFSIVTYTDSKGEHFMGENTYRLRVSAEVPVANFWQIPIYEVKTRAMIQTDQNKYAFTGYEGLKRNQDGSVDLYFGPKAPEGFENNWIKTIPGEGWFTLPRLYGPLEPVLDRTWRWNDFELIEAVDGQESTGAIPEYIGGYPTAETAEAMFEEYDYQAAVQFYVWAYAHLNNLGMHKALVELGGDERSFYSFDKRVGPQHQIMTANTMVVYTWSRIVVLSKGPVVMDIPRGVRGHMYDMSSRAYQDVGDVGPDKGQGGKYLVVNADFDGAVPDGHHLVKNPYSDTIILGVRTFPTSEGSVEAAVDVARQIKWYYLSEADNPPDNSFVSIGTNAFSQEWPRDERAFEWLSDVFNLDKVPASGLAHMGNMRRLGIEADKPFNPDERAKRILKRAAKTAEAMVLSMAYSDRVTENTYDNRQYGPIFTSQNPTFYTENYEEAEERVAQGHMLIANVAVQIPATPGTGGFYTNTFTDSDGNFLLGENTYRLRVPANVPVKQFWQIPVYSAKTRAMINNDQGRFSLGGIDDLKRETDGSVILYFGPEAPQGYEKNWIQTNPGEGWFTLPRLFAPLEPILDKSWRWNDIERISNQ